MDYVSLKTVLIFIHLVGVVLGLGSATVADILFLKSILNNRIHSKQFNFLKIITKLVMIGLGVLYVSGFAFLFYYTRDTETINLIFNPKVWAKLTIVLVLTLNGLILHYFILPLLEKNIDKSLHTVNEIRKHRLLFFGSGAVSGVSWWCSMILGVWKEINFILPYTYIVGAYFTILFMTIIGSIPLSQFILKLMEKAPIIGRWVKSEHRFDALTGLPNSQEILLNLESEMKRADRYRSQLEVIFLKINNYNELKSRLIEDDLDKVIYSLSEKLKTIPRLHDTIGRYGSESFVLLLPSNSFPSLTGLLHRINLGITSLKETNEPNLKVIEIGFASFHYKQGVKVIPKEIITFCEEHLQPLSQFTQMVSDFINKKTAA